MVTCAICGKRLAAKVIGACSDCLRSLPEGELAPAFHKAAREKLGLPVVPPRVPAGAKCRLCANECQPGPEKNGYCGLRKSARGKLKKASHEAFPLRTVEDKLRHPRLGRDDPS